MSCEIKTRPLKISGTNGSIRSVGENNGVHCLDIRNQPAPVLTKGETHQYYRLLVSSGVSEDEAREKVRKIRPSATGNLETDVQGHQNLINEQRRITTSVRAVLSLVLQTGRNHNQEGSSQAQNTIVSEPQPLAQAVTVFTKK